MKQLRSVLMCLSCLVPAPLLAQTTIGGGTCNSATLNGVYALTLTGRQVNSAGGFTGVFQGNGSAVFDGLSKVTIALTADTNQAVGAAQNWSGTYTVQANCGGTLTITTGGSASFNLLIFSGGSNFQVSGSDSTFTYSGSGDTQPSGCSAGSFSGTYQFNAQGFVLAGNTVAGAETSVGLLTFDGVNKITVNITTAAPGAPSTPVALTGTYTAAASCTATATLSDGKGGNYVMSFTVFNQVKTYASGVYVALAQSSKFILQGVSRALYGQPGNDATATCSPADLNGTYALTLNGRAISAAGIFTGALQGNGTATFDGAGKVTINGTGNTNLLTGVTLTFNGTYTVSANCTGTLNITTTGPVTFALVEWNGGKQLNISGADANYVYAGNGSATKPPACATPSVSGTYTYTATGFLLQGTTPGGTGEENGVLQFDGQGNLTANLAVFTAGAAPTQLTATGTYTVNSTCLGSATVTDSGGNATAVKFVVMGNYGENVDLLESSPKFIRTGVAHSAFTNPSQAIGNVASYAYSATPPGSVFVLFGQNLATRASAASTTPLPTTLLTTSVTVNGEPAPLFYVDSGQIDAQLPWDIPGNTVATVVVKNGNATSNAAAMFIPATGTPGISVYGTNRAVVVNQNGSVNSPSASASVGDEVVAYFTGGGPVQAAGKLTTGAPSPNGLSPVTGQNSVSVGNVQARVDYIGLTPGSVGLYQANFFVPQIARGTYPVVITIAGQASNNPLMTVGN